MVDERGGSGRDDVCKLCARSGEPQYAQPAVFFFSSFACVRVRVFVCVCVSACVSACVC